MVEKGEVRELSHPRGEISRATTEITSKFTYSCEGSVGTLASFESRAHLFEMSELTEFKSKSEGVGTTRDDTDISRVDFKRVRESLKSL